LFIKVQNTNNKIIQIVNIAIPDDLGLEQTIYEHIKT